MNGLILCFYHNAVIPALCLHCPRFIMCTFNIFITGLNNWLLIYSLTWHISYGVLNFKLQQFLGHDLGEREKMQHYRTMAFKTDSFLCQQQLFFAFIPFSFPLFLQYHHQLFLVIPWLKSKENNPGSHPACRKNPRSSKGKGTQTAKKVCGLCPNTRGGLLAKQLQEDEDRLCVLTGFRIKIQETGGTQLKNCSKQFYLLDHLLQNISRQHAMDKADPN